MLESLSPTNVQLLRDVCDYVSSLAGHNNRVVQQFGNLIMRADSDLMSDGSREVSCIFYARASILNPGPPDMVRKASRKS